MSRVAIVKIRSRFDLEWRPSSLSRRALELARAHQLLDRIEASEGLPFMPQLTLPYLAGLGRRYNERRGTNHAFHILDREERELHLDRYDLVLFTAATLQAPATYALSDRLRLRGIPTVIGGIHATLMPEEAGRHATSVVVGEAEGALEALLQDFDADRTLAPRYDGGKVSDLTGMPLPDWKGYYPFMVPMETSRGCPNACHYCSTTRVQGARRRHRPVGDVVRELETLKEQGIITPSKSVFFTDNNIVSDTTDADGVRDTRYARELFEALIPLDIVWAGQGEIRVGEDEALVALMAASGCFALLAGLESMEPASLDSVGKLRINQVEQYERSFACLHRHGIEVVGCFIMGLDGDGPETFDETRRFIDRFVDIPQVTLLTPFPGTALHRRMKRDGRILHEDWSRYDAGHVVFQPARMSPEELADRWTRLVDAVYHPAAIARRVMRYTFTQTVDGLPRFSLSEKLLSVLAPNVIYGRLLREGTRGLRRERRA